MAAHAAAPSLEWSAGAGLLTAFGSPITALGSPREPATKVSLPVEATIGVIAGPGVLVRAHLGSGLLLNGTFLYSTSGGELVGFPHHVDLFASAGYRRSGVSVGALGGLQFPTRPTARGFVGWSPPEGRLTVELRGGVNLPSERPLEPVLQLLVGVRGRVRRG